LEAGPAQTAGSDPGHDAEEARAQGADDDHREVRQCFEGAGRRGHEGADPVRGRKMSYAADLSFAYYQPTRVVFGAGVVRDLGLECKRLGIERAVIVTDQILRTKTDVVARVEQALGTRSVGVYDGVIPDTSVQAIDSGARFAKERGCDGLISV